MKIGGLAASYRLKARGCLSIMHEPHVNPPVSGFDLTGRGVYVVRS
jgi:hypothetical protein